MASEEVGRRRQYGVIVRLVLVCIILGMVGAAYLAGYVTADKRLFPAQYIEWLKGAVKRAITDDSGVAVVDQRRLETATLNLEMVKVRVPIDDPGAGGALTSVGGELVLLSRFGDLYLVEGNIPHPLSLSTPDNHFEEYATLAASGDDGLTHNPDSLRFNDILYLPGTSGDALILSYTEWHPESACYTTSLARLALPPGMASIAELDAGPQDWQVVFRTQPCLPLKSTMRAIEGHMAGGRLAPAGENAVYLGSGDYHWDGVYAPEALAQKEDNDYGKVIRIDVLTGSAHHVSTGQRNLQGITVTPEGEIWTTEHGPRGGDELNLVQEGNNYGWPLATLGTRYNRLPWPGADYGRHSAFRGPVYAWVPSIGVSNVTQVHQFDPSWNGDLLVASLRGQSLFRLRIVDDHVRFAEQIVIGERVRYVQEHSDGRIVLWTDTEHLVFLSRDDSTPTAAFIEQSIDSMSLDAAQRADLREAVMACQECHSFDYLGADGAPTLASIYGRAIASTDYGFYSDALAARKGVWTTQELTRYLTDPTEAVPGTTMPRPNLPSQTVKDLVDLLELLSAAE